MPTDEAFLQDRVDTLFDTTFNDRGGRVVPSTSDVALKNGAVKIDAAFLYSDLAGSAFLSKTCPWSTTAKIMRAFLDCSTRLILKHGGQVRSFDGDRVMGVFIGDSKSSNASICGREIHWSVRQIIQPAAEKRFKSISKHGIQIRNCSGVDVGEVRAVRAGVRNSNDLIWIGKAASFSAKLSDIRDGAYCTYISRRTYKNLKDEAKYNGDGKDMWEAKTFTFADATETVYRSSSWKKP